MSKKAVQTLVSYGVAVLLGLGLAVLVAFNFGFGDAENAMVRYRILCDASTIPGVVLFSGGVLCWVAGQGMFDALAYVGRSLLRVFHREERHVRYYEFVEERREKRAEKEKGHFLFLIITGAAFLLAAGIFMLLFYRLYNAS